MVRNGHWIPLERPLNVKKKTTNQEKLNGMCLLAFHESQSTVPVEGYGECGVPTLTRQSEDAGHTMVMIWCLGGRFRIVC